MIDTPTGMLYIRTKFKFTTLFVLHRFEMILNLFFNKLSIWLSLGRLSLFKLMMAKTFCLYCKAYAVNSYERRC
jgi:hypothetical protein